MIKDATVSGGGLTLTVFKCNQEGLLFNYVSTDGSFIKIEYDIKDKTWILNDSNINMQGIDVLLLRDKTNNTNNMKIQTFTTLSDLLLYAGFNTNMTDQIMKLTIKLNNLWESTHDEEILTGNMTHNRINRGIKGMKTAKSFYKQRISKADSAQQELEDLGNLDEGAGNIEITYDPIELKICQNQNMLKQALHIIRQLTQKYNKKETTPFEKKDIETHMKNIKSKVVQTIPELQNYSFEALEHALELCLIPHILLK